MSVKDKLSALVKGKCPKCHVGNMFIHGAFYHKGFGKMNKECSNCKVVFEREPGYFYGAMYISYAFSVGVFLLTSVLLYYLADNPSLNTYILTVLGVALVTYPINFRFSKILFLHTLGGIEFDPPKDNH